MQASSMTIRGFGVFVLLATVPLLAQFQAPAAGPAAHGVLLSVSYPAAPLAAVGDAITHSSSFSSSSAELPDAPTPPVVSLADEYAWTLPPPAPLLPSCSKQVAAGTVQQPCLINPYHRFLDTTTPVPMTVGQKGYLAIHDVKDPGNLVTIAGTAAFNVGTNAHNPYGPGFKGWGRNAGYSFTQDATGEFFGTFLVPSIFHEDPHYHREPGRPIPHRLLHAVSRTFMAQSDYGNNMPNYATLLTYPITAEISNLYVPGVNGNGPSTVKRIATGLATDPVNNVITEFLPDIARHINIRVIFVQRMINMMTANSTQGAGLNAVGQ